MEYLFNIFIGVPFLYWNYKITTTDIKEKRIPNKYLLYLLYLLPFWYVYAWYYGYFSEVYVGVFLLQSILTLIVSFAIYYFGKWGAGDAKYVLVLSLFIPHIGIIPFIFSIAIVTILYLVWYFIWFWIGPNLWNTEKRRNLYTNLWKIKKDDFSNTHRNTPKYIIFKKLLFTISVLLTLFMVLRLLRLYLVDYITLTYNIPVFELFLSIIYSPLILSGVIAILLFCIFVGRKIYFYFTKNIPQKYYIPLLIFVNIGLIIFLINEYIKNPNDISEKIVLIFTLYLFIAVAGKILLFAYKLVFIAREEEMIHIDQLEEGMMIDKKYLVKVFQNQSEKSSKKIIPSLQSNITKEDKILIKSTFRKINTHLKDRGKAQNLREIYYIKILHTSPYGCFIAGGYIVAIILHTALM